MLLHTGRSGLCSSDLCLFNMDLGRGPFPIGENVGQGAFLAHLHQSEH